MGFFRSWLRKEVEPRRSAATVSPDPQREEVRRELMNMAVRDTLQKHGIPPQWIAAEVHRTLAPGGTRSMHLRLVMREWQPKLLAYTVALQKAVQARLIRLDPLAQSWLTGISWKFDPVDDVTCPRMPAADYWSGMRSDAPAKPPAARALLDSILSKGDRTPSRHAEGGDFRATEPMQR